MARADSLNGNLTPAQRLEIVSMTGTLNINIDNATLSGSNLTFYITNNEPFPLHGVSVAAEIVRDDAMNADFPKPSDTILFSTKTGEMDLGAGETAYYEGEIGAPTNLGAGNFRLDLYILVQGNSLREKFENRIPDYFRRISSSSSGNHSLSISLGDSSVCRNATNSDLFQDCSNLSAVPVLASQSDNLSIQIRGLQGDSVEPISVSVQLLDGDRRVFAGTYGANAANGSFSQDIAITLPPNLREYLLVLSATDSQGKSSIARLPISIAGAYPKVLAVIASADNLTLDNDEAMAVILSRPMITSGRYYASETLAYGNTTFAEGPKVLGLSNDAFGYGAVWNFSPKENISRYSVYASVTNPYGEILSSSSIIAGEPTYVKAQPPGLEEYAFPVAVVAIVFAFFVLPIAAKRQRLARELKTKKAEAGKETEKRDDKRRDAAGTKDGLVVEAGKADEKGEAKPAEKLAEIKIPKKAT